MCKQIRNIGGFIAFILETEIVEAKEWVNDFKTSVDSDLWIEYLETPFTRLNVMGFATAVSNGGLLMNLQKKFTAR